MQPEKVKLLFPPCFGVMKGSPLGTQFGLYTQYFRSANRLLNSPPQTFYTISFFDVLCFLAPRGRSGHVGPQHSQRLSQSRRWAVMCVASERRKIRNNPCFKLLIHFFPIALHSINSYRLVYFLWLQYTTILSKTFPEVGNWWVLLHQIGATFPHDLSQIWRSFRVLTKWRSNPLIRMTRLTRLKQPTVYKLLPQSGPNNKAVYRENDIRRFFFNPIGFSVWTHVWVQVRAPAGAWKYTPCSSCSQETMCECGWNGFWRST